MIKHISHILFLTLILGTFAPSPSDATEPPQLGFPVDCQLNGNCWIANYVDVDPAENSIKDFTCNAKTYDGHKGTDFALASRDAMMDGVNVLATLDGKVLRLRDGESDHVKTSEEFETLSEANKDCGNGVIIDHSDDLVTFYCHLKNGSITVKPGDEVKKGDIIAQIGQSGVAEFPHLHLALIHNDKYIDPFTGHSKEDGCGKFTDNLWEDDLKYAPYALYDSGFANVVPDFKAIDAGTRPNENITKDSAAFIYWISFYQIEKGDKISMAVRDPNGNIFVERQIIAEKNRARQHYYTGRKLANIELKPGTYTATTTIKKKGHEPISVETTIEIE